MNSAGKNFQFLTFEEKSKLTVYRDLLFKWNRSMNLSGGKSLAELEALFEDSFALAEFMKTIFPRQQLDLDIWDLGAGAGLPGIPLRIIWQNGRYTLIEARQKRALFLANVLAKLKLPRTSLFTGRAEEFFNRSPEGSDCILSRAFMPWEKLLPFCASHLRPGARIVVMANSACTNVPGGWTLELSRSYYSGGCERWLWALARDSHVHS